MVAAYRREAILELAKERSEKGRQQNEQREHKHCSVYSRKRASENQKSASIC